LGDTFFVIIGGGPAGLTAAYELTTLDLAPLVLERASLPGGIARTETYKGFHFDMGGHRFFTKSEEVHRLWQEVLRDDLLVRPRLSRIYYKGRFFHYPLKAKDAFLGLGPREAVLILASYLRWQIFPHSVEETLDQWVTNRFGKRLFQTFFKTYTEKVWGIPCTELRAEWAAQRIKDLSFRSLLLSLVVKPGRNIKSLIEEFEYPRQGPGMMWRAVCERIEARGGSVRFDSEVVRIGRAGPRITHVVARNGSGEHTVAGTHFISSMPVTEFVQKLDPVAPAEVRAAASALRYRDLITVGLIVDNPHLFPDNWIYVHSPEVRVARIQNFKNWSPDMVPDARMSSLGLEYFCNEGDDLWSQSDAELVELGCREVERIGLLRAEEVVDGCVFRVPRSYPVYDARYREHLAVLRHFMESLENCQTVGRNGLHRYNNQDHSMLTGMYAARNLVLGEKNDLWSVNADMDYQEELPPRRHGTEELVRRAFSVLLARVDPVALGVSLGLLLGSVILALTVMLVWTGDAVVGRFLSLLSQYFPGYQVTLPGAFIGFAYGAAVGFAAGFAFARIRNRAMRTYVSILKWRARRAHLRKLLDEI
jgi:protoporphyrinogen oxidase